MACSFFARPGPFVMAELKNEGLPFRLYERHPEIHAGRLGRRGPTRRGRVDYLAPGFLAEARRWYAAVMPILARGCSPTAATSSPCSSTTRSGCCPG